MVGFGTNNRLGTTGTINDNNRASVYGKISGIYEDLVGGNVRVLCMGGGCIYGELIHTDYNKTVLRPSITSDGDLHKSIVDHERPSILSTSGIAGITPVGDDLEKICKALNREADEDRK